MRTILIIDADVQTKNDLRVSLKKMGYKVFYSNKGKTGLGKAYYKNPDLIITNLVLPDLDGLDLIKELKADMSLKSKPIIVLSEKIDEFHKALALEVGADNYIEKPANLIEVDAKIKSLLKNHRKNTKQTLFKIPENLK